jgi:hypothetical protein
MHSSTAFQIACRSVLAHCKDEYAKSYAAVGLGLIDDEAIRVQSLYILNNIRHWRGPEAKDARETFKTIGGIK